MARSRESLVRDSSGKVTHVRVTTEDGRHSTLHEARQGVDVLISGVRGPAVEHSDHRPDGTTTAYEADNSFVGIVLHGGKGKRKG